MLLHAFYIWGITPIPIFHFRTLTTTMVTSPQSPTLPNPGPSSSRLHSIVERSSGLIKLRRSRSLSRDSLHMSIQGYTLSTLYCLFVIPDPWMLSYRLSGCPATYRCRSIYIDPLSTVDHTVRGSAALISQQRWPITKWPG